MKINKKKLIVIVGPTASGKTKLAIKLAKQLDAEIISADSRQFYREMEIGTAKPSLKELAEVKHHFINNLSVKDTYTAGIFKKEVDLFLKKYFKLNDNIILVGGSGLYIDSIINGMDDLPVVNKKIRDKINLLFKNKGLEFLKDELKRLDPNYYKLVDVNNHRRIIRALEVCYHSNKPYSSFLQKKKKIYKKYDVIVIGLNPSRELLYKNINYRVDLMINKGLVNEVKSLLKFKDLNSLNTVGYKEIFKFLDKKITLEEAVEKVKSNTRKYSKRQITWFKRNKNIIWFKNSDAKIIEYFKKINS